MYNESKLTYVVVSSLVVVLAFVAYFLQGNTDDFADGSASTSTSTQVTKKVTDSYKVGQKETLNSSTTKQDQTNLSATNTTIMSNPQNITSAIIKTNLGDVEFSFATTAPNTTQNFISLASAKFYDGVKFHRVIRDFMIQTGDPLSKDDTKRDYWGTGGPGYKFNDELSGREVYTQGTVAMANSGPNTNGSQFFIVTASPASPLPPSYTVFGHVTKGLDVALKIQDMQTGARDVPVQNIVIKSVELR